MAKVPYNSEEFISLMENAYAAFQQMTQAFGDIQEYVRNAAASEEAAQQSAQDAQGFANEAAGRVSEVENVVSEAMSAAEQAQASAETAMQYSGKPPQILDGTWHVWNADTQEYTDTGIRAVGDEGAVGPPGPQGPQGEPGKINVLYGTQDLTPGVSALEAGSIYVVYE